MDAIAVPMTDHLRKSLYETGRLETQLFLAKELLSLFPDAGREKELADVQAFIRDKHGSVSVDKVRDFVLDAEKLMPATSAFARSHRIHVTTHAHIDMNWMWGYDETVAVALDTFRTMLALMDQYPDFTYAQSQASVYRMVEQYDPDMLEAIRQRVKEGRWEISSSTWVEGDKNMASGESQIRQVLQAKEYFKKMFGLDYDQFQLDYEPDTFGHPAFTPTVLASCGVKYYYHCRGFNGPKMYRWQAPDGSSVLCYSEQGNDWYNYLNIKPEQVLRSFIGELRAVGAKDVLRVIGVGDHGGGPTVRDINRLNEMKSWPVMPTIAFSRYSDYFKAIDEADIDIPVVSGEHNYIFTGCYTSQSLIKKANRVGEKNLLQAETLAALASHRDTSFAYPSEQLSQAWEYYLFNHFHDILPGSGVRETRHYSMGKHQEIMATTATVSKRAIQRLTGQMDTASAVKAANIPEPHHVDDWAQGAGVGFWQDSKGMSAPALTSQPYRIFTVFNPSAFARTEVVEAVLWDMSNRGRLTVKDQDGNEVTHQVIDKQEYEPIAYWGHNYRRILIEAANVPPMGYKTFVVYEDTTRPIGEALIIFDAPRTEPPMGAVMENEHLRLELDTQTGAVRRLLAKDSNTELLEDNQLLGLFRMIDEGRQVAPTGNTGWEQDGSMTAWLIGAYMNIEPVKGARFTRTVQGPVTLTVEKSTLTAVNGPLRQGYVWKAKCRNSTLSVGVSLDKGSRRIHFEVKCDWLEVGKGTESIPQLNVVFPLAVKDSKRLFETPFGAISRTDNDMDVPVLRWADISGAHTSTGKQVGITVMSDSKYGYRADDNSLAISLLRSSTDPDPYPELGEHRFCMGVAVHEGQCERSQAYREAIAFDQPLIVSQVTENTGSLPASGSFMQCDADNVVLSCLKQAQDGQAMVLRLFEVEGRDTNVTLTLDKDMFGGEATITPADGMEQPAGDSQTTAKGAARVSVPANGVVTLRVKAV